VRPIRLALAAVKATVAVDLKGKYFCVSPSRIRYLISKSFTLSFVCPVQRWRDKLSFALSVPHKFVISSSTTTNHGDDIDQLADPLIQKILPTLHTLGVFSGKRGNSISDYLLLFYLVLA